MGGRLLGARTYTVERRVQAWVDGVATITVDSTYTARISVQPMSWRDRQELPEGVRDRDARYGYAHVRLRAVDRDHPDQPWDVVLVDGRRYEVAGVQDWSHHRASTAHYQHWLVLEREGDAA